MKVNFAAERLIICPLVPEDAEAAFHWRGDLICYEQKDMYQSLYRMICEPMIVLNRIGKTQMNLCSLFALAHFFIAFIEIVGYNKYDA